MSWAMFAVNHNLNNEIADQARALGEAHAEIRQLKKKLRDTDFHEDQALAHLAAEEALRLRAMEEIDKAVGAENNPLRQQAYKDPEAMRVPSGSRKGEVMTVADHVYISKFAEKFNDKYAKWAKVYKNVNSWKDFLRERISY